MPTCNQTSGGLSPLTQALYDEFNRKMMDEPLQPFGPCYDTVAKKNYYQFEYVNETQLQVNGVPYNVTIGDEWVDLKRAEGQPRFGDSTILGDITIHRSQYNIIINELKEGHRVVTVEFYG